MPTADNNSRSTEAYLVKMLNAAGQYKLADLISVLEQRLMPMVDVSNCVELFVRAEETGAEALRKFCASLMSSHWVFLVYCFFHRTRYVLQQANRVFIQG